MTLENAQIHPNAMEYEDFVEHYATINQIKLYYECVNCPSSQNGRSNNSSGTTANSNPLQTNTAVLLVHGWTATRFMLHPLYLFLDDKHVPTFRIDLRGHGWSQKDDNLDYSLPTLADDLVKFVQEIIIAQYKFEKVILIGHSMGGTLVQSAAVQLEDVVEKLVLICTSPYFFDNFVRKIGASLEVKNWKKDYRKMYGKKRAGQEELGIEHFPPWFDKFNTKGRTLLPGRTVPWKTIESMKSFDVRQQIDGYPKPTLIIAAEKDILATPRFSKWLHAHIPDSELHIIPGGVHNIDIDKPLTVRKLIQPFLNI